ncbi:MAG: hypothetical protein HFJ48_05510 [Clostridia bacterium]|nr:hypothetical protein [Clostridia bacterium]
MKDTKVIELTIKQLLILPLIIIAILITIAVAKDTRKMKIAEEVKNTRAELEDMVKRPLVAIEGIKEAPVNTTIAKRKIEESRVTTRSENVGRQENVALANAEQEVQLEETKYKSIEEIVISKDMDLTERTGISKEDFKILISNVKQDKTKFFYDNSDIIYDVCEEYQINEIFFCGLISAESGWDIVKSHRNTHNYISLMSKGKLIRYSSEEEGLKVAAQKLHENYLSEDGKYYNGTTLEDVKVKFCPKSKKWVDLVYNGMEKIVNN